MTPSIQGIPYARPVSTVAVVRIPPRRAATMGCGDDTSEPEMVVDEMTVTPINSKALPDGTVRHTSSLAVTDGGNLRIAGAWMLVQVSAGDVTPQTDRTDLSGNGRVEWTLEPAGVGGISSAMLSGCAPHQAPPGCPLEPLATLTFD